MELPRPAEPNDGSREIQFYAHTFRLAIPTGSPDGTVLGVYDNLGRPIGSTQEGWLFREGEDYLVGSFRAILPGPGAYSFASPRTTGNRTGRTY
ncbi:MAG: hypothetical protein M3463_21845 [Verrucomicrobiota bacterium]|nr:hypothetical protein [Verrucomicrobiota bacterium]